MTEKINKQLLEALEAMCEIYEVEDESLENDAVAGYAMNILEQARIEALQKPKPLPIEIIWMIAQEHVNTHDPEYPINFARAVEQQHGIGVEDDARG